MGSRTRWVRNQPSRRALLKGGGHVAGGLTLDYPPRTNTRHASGRPWAAGRLSDAPSDKAMVAYASLSFRDSVHTARAAVHRRVREDVHWASPIQIRLAHHARRRSTISRRPRQAFLPDIDPSNILDIHGLVDRPLTFTMEDLSVPVRQPVALRRVRGKPNNARHKTVQHRTG